MAMRIVIVGGGVMGSSVAYNLASRPDLRGAEITVVERDPAYTRASSSLSASSIREQFSTPINIAMSQFGLAFLRDAEALLATDDHVPLLSLTSRGYLFLASRAGLPVLHANHATQRAAGSEVAVLEPAELAARFPWLNLDGVAAGSLGLAGEGWFDGPALLAAFRRKARALGVTYVAAHAIGFRRAGDLADAVVLEDGSAIPCDVAVNAAGPWAGALASSLREAIPIRPRLRMVFVLSCPDPLPGLPLLIEPGGIWVRPEGRSFLCGRSPGPGEADPDEPPLTVDETMFTETIWPVLAHRIPAMERVRVSSSWAGYYEVNTFDHNGVVGALPGSPNVIHAAGFSGHGMQHAPAVGRGVAELIGAGEYETLDLSPLSPTRIAAGRPLRELAVV